MATATTATKTAAAAKLTLQQKFVELRRAIPSITQKKHSDGVKYKFAKIFDVYELLTPAMNEYGVNFDIVGETATRHADNGDPLFYSSYDQHTRNGSRTVWVYEADITIRWTNADNPEDMQEVTLHAIGTNDGGPDKAKGSAWTYCLKYYLFEKFGIDQGDDDPDMNDHGNEPAHCTTAQSGGGYRNTQTSAQSGQNGQTRGTRGLSDAQLQRMYRKGEEVNVTKEQIDATIVKKYGATDPHQLTRAQYDAMCDGLDGMRNGGQQNA